VRRLSPLALTVLALGLAAPVLGAEPGAVVFHNVTVLDMTGGPPRRNATVVVRGERVDAVGASGKVAVPAGAKVVDGRGKFLIPGLWDMHAHIYETSRSLPLFLANGVTGVRIMAGHPDDLFRWRREIAEGKLLGPRIVTCGPLIDGPQPADPDNAVAVHDADDARRRVDTLAAQGADFIKVHDRVPRDAYFAILDEAKKKGLTVVGHVPDALTIEEVSNAGQKSIEHIGPVIETCSTATDELARMKAQPIPEGDFSAFPKRLAARGNLALDTFSAEKCERLFAVLKKNGTWQVPTLVTKRTLTEIDELARTADPRLRFVPARQRERWKPENDFFARYRTPDYITYRRRAYRKEKEIVGAMYRAGVPILAGTDLIISYIYAGFSLHDEMALLVESGLPPLAALQAATVNPARFLGLDDLGTVEPGKTANLVLLDADPLANIHNTQKIAAVVLRGRLLEKPELQKMLDDAAADAARAQ
jgi:imidazolonepropionase-like amidohydrolase